MQLYFIFAVISLPLIKKTSAKAKKKFEPLSWSYFFWNSQVSLHCWHLISRNNWENSEICSVLYQLQKNQSIAMPWTNWYRIRTLMRLFERKKMKKNLIFFWCLVSINICKAYSPPSKIKGYILIIN